MTINAKVHSNGAYYFWRGSKDDLAQLQAKLAAKQMCYVSDGGEQRWRYGIEVAQSGIVLSGEDMKTPIYRWNWTG